MQIRRATRADLVQLCVTAVKAFASDPVMRWIFPDDDEYLQHEARSCVERCPDGSNTTKSGAPTTSPHWPSGVQPGRPETPESSDPSLAPPSPELLDRLAIIGPLLAQHAPTQDHWYLQLLATHPDWQRQGLGAALMASMFERADAEGLPCHLETETFVNVGYYRRHGFEVHSEFDIPTGPHEHRFSSFDDDPATEAGPHMWGMLRLSR